jgi:hypothetical protein
MKCLGITGVASAARVSPRGRHASPQVGAALLLFARSTAPLQPAAGSGELSIPEFAKA